MPIAVHLDHCIDHDDVEVALMLPLDSLMVDASTSDPESNISYCGEIARRAATLGITVEAEMGRIEGGEDGLKTVEMEVLLTDPQHAKEFVERTGVHFLAPSFGNVHGPYPAGGAEKFWQLDRYVSATYPFCRLLTNVRLKLRGHRQSDWVRYPASTSRYSSCI